MFSRKNTCSVEELKDLVNQYDDVLASIESLANASEPVNPKEYSESLRRLAQELRAIAKRLDECRRSLEDPVQHTEEKLKKYSIV